MLGTQMMGTAYMSVKDLKRNYCEKHHSCIHFSHVLQKWQYAFSEMLEPIWNKCRAKTNLSEVKHDPDISDVFISKSQIMREHTF